MVLEQINSEYSQLIDADNGVTGSIIEEDGIIYVQKCLHGEYCYAPYEIYGDKDETMTIPTHSTDTCSLCNNAPTFKENPLSRAMINLSSGCLKTQKGWSTRAC